MHTRSSTIQLVQGTLAAKERAGTSTPLLPPTSGYAACGLVLCAGDEAHPVTAPLCLGSAPGCDVVFKDPYVSARHAAISPDGEGVRVSDLGSKNGTFVNGARVERALLPMGGVLRVGQTQLRLQAAAAPSRLIGESDALARVRRHIETYAPMDLPVLIHGESGTGKDVVARALHERSGRRGAFVAINCAALPRELIESELFGHERGAFTGAQRRHLGCFGEAEGGTLFLDEIAELPLELQPRLLRALESRSIRPIGHGREIPVDVRIVAATHCDLEEAVAEDRFRLDLYYRLHGLLITVPPLRERPEDIVPLVLHFMHEISAKVGPCSLMEEGRAQLMRAPWPGNVRELKHAVQRAAYLNGPLLRAADILSHTPCIARPASPGGAGRAMGRRFADIERKAYLDALRESGGSRRRAAARLGIPKSTLCDKLRRMGF